MSSKETDPLLDLVQLLRPRAVLLGRGLDAAGEWGIKFPAKNDLLFCLIERGECSLIAADEGNTHLRSGDFVLFRTSSPIILTSDPYTEPVDSVAAVAGKRGERLKMGSGSRNPVTLHAGKFLFQRANEALILELLPAVVHVRSDVPSGRRVQTLLAMAEQETRQPELASSFVTLRLMELVLIEILRSSSGSAGGKPTGMVAGLSDPVTARAMKAMHANIQADWTVAMLAKLCGVSRSAFAYRFRNVLGTSPIEYLLNWRMAVAKDELTKNGRRVEEVAFKVGFRSASAFSTAFTRSQGCSPREFLNSRRMGALIDDETTSGN
ncbi:AraC family transcriptional regulator [Phyllobacterium sp. CCNWLW109]|uniref:AraC family transcriptional regulator n=1 Tax=Phyllobacterium sp. CCNWLW109 TaxID=3127479 RepID=UPI003076DB25